MEKINLKVFISRDHNPYFNLATEDWIFRHMDPNGHILFLWRNQPTVVIGRFQNPWVECKLDQMEQDGVLLTRRQSGGGAVYHDLGNTNFTFLSGRDLYDKEANLKIICQSLAKWGIEAAPSGRNDILVDERKISGSAFKETKDRVFHHGTLLISADLGKLNNYLNPSKRKLEGKGVKSVRSRVANLVEFNPQINHEDLSKEIIEEFFAYYGTRCEIEELSSDFLKKQESLNEYYEKLKDWKWRLGETPKFTHEFSERFSWGEIDFKIMAHKGIMKEVTIYSDSLHPEMIEEIQRSFVGQAYSKDGVSSTLTKIEESLPIYKDYLDDLKNWMKNNIEGE